MSSVGPSSRTAPFAWSTLSCPKTKTNHELSWSSDDLVKKLYNRTWYFFFLVTFVTFCQSAYV